MSVYRPKEWIATVLGKFDKLLELSVTQNISLSSQLESHKDCLINISESKCPTIISGLTTSLKKLSNIRIYGDRQEYKLYSSQIVVLNLLEKCITAKDSALPEDSILMKQLLSEICQFLHQPTNDKALVEQLKASASRVLYCISQNNFNIVFSRIANRLHDLYLNSDDFTELNDLDLIQHVHINITKLTKLLDEIILKFKSLKKSVQLSVLANLDAALWGWVCTYPDELNLLYQPVQTGFDQGQQATDRGEIHLQIQQEERLARNRRLSVAAEQLFDLVDGSGEVSKKKAASLWPLQTLLLLLCPDVVKQVASRKSQQQQQQPKSSKIELLATVKRHLSSSVTRQLQEYSVDSLVRVAKVACCVAPSCGEDQLPLHRLVDSFLPEFQTFLFDGGSKYFNKTSDEESLIECFVCSFRLAPDLLSLPRLCASSSSSIHHKVVLVQALCCLSTQPPLSWWPKVDRLYSYGSDIRKIFRDCVAKTQTQVHASPRNTQSIRVRMERMNVGLKRSQDESPNHRDLLRVILQLIQSNPSLLLHNLGSTSQQIHSEMFDFSNHLVLLFSIHPQTNLQLAVESSGALLRLHDPLNIALWNPESTMATFWEVSSHVVSSVCDKLLASQMMTSPELTLHAIKWLQQVLARRIEFVMQNHTRQGTNNTSDAVRKTKLKLEQTLLEHLWHQSEEVVSVALTCFQGLYEETELRWTFDDCLGGRLYTERYECYQELSSAALLDDGDVIHKRVKSVLRKMNRFPQASLQAWEDTLNKWEAKTHSLSHKQSKDDYAVVTSAGESPNSGKSTKKALATEQEVHDWTNLSGFLCSLGGVCAKSVEVVSSSLTSLAWDRRTSSSSVLSSSAGPSSPSDHHGNARQGPGSSSVSSGHASRFVGHLINMLFKANSRIPDVSAIVRNLLAYDLHPALFPTLFQQITFVLKTNLFDSEGRIVQNHFTDQLVHGVIYILQIIFQDSSEQDGDYLGEESIEDTILYIVRYIRQMGARMSAFALRILFCKMVTELMIRKSDFFFLSEIKFRNKLVEHLADWLMTLSNQNTNSNHVLLRELDESAVVAIGALLDGLPLHPDEGDGGDVPKAKSQLFLKYFTLFMRLLSTDDCQGNNDVINGDDVTALRSSVILAMSKLLSANIEYGLVHAMGLAYHPDIQTRAAFLEVLIKILQQGTAGFDTLGDSVSAERFERLVELVTMMGDNGELPIANALANVVHTTYMDELARVFVTLFDAKHLLYQLLWNMFTKEVEEAPNGQTLFRGNSLASKIMKFCFKVYGASYLHNLVEPLIEWSLGPEIVALQFEVDQKRIQPGAGVDILQCRANLQRLTERFFTRIMTSTDKFPPQLKSVCHCLYQVVSQRFHESGTGAVASAIFLRFLNPAIATPYEMGLSDKPIPPNLAKAFKLVCKLMQKIANHVVFTKEEHMKHFNEFVKARFDVCQQFFMQISTPECASLEGVVHSNPIVNGSNVQALHRLLWNDQEKIGQFLANSRNAKAVGRRPFDKMVTLLAYLGPPEYTRPVLETRTTGQTITPCKFEELMTKRKVAESDQFKMVKGLNIFYQFGRSKMGYPVFYYIAKRYIQSEIREDILMFYILQALKPYSSRKFDVIIDLTHVEANNGFRQQYLPKWLVVYTPQIYKNLNAVYVYNPNTWVMAYVNRNQAFFDKVKHSNIIFLDHLSDLQEHIDPDHQKIPSATKSLDEDIAVFRNVYRSGPTKVDLKIGSRAVQFTSVEKHKLLNRDVVLNDIFYASEIESIQSVDDSHTFGLKVACDNAVIIFSHPEALRIAQGLRHLRARWELTQPELSTPHHKIGAKDVPGTLLNMALLNLGCPDPVVRSSAYNLLCVLTSCFHLQLEGRLCGSEGLCIPANNTLFIVSISTTLAKNESHLTLEFLDECITGYRCLSDTLKNLCLEYMEPWLFNLPAFVSPSEYKRNKVKSVIHKLIELTIAERDFYPSVQIKVWGNLGMLSPLTDLILEAFVETSSEGGLSSLKAEVMADTSVSLAVSNIKVVSGKLINLLCTIVDKTSLRPTPTLQKHKHWEEIAILARFLLMLSFNNNLDVITQLPNLFHLVTLLLSTGPISLRASVHGLVVNIIHSLLTCNRPEFKERTRQVLRLSLTEFCLPKFYLYFGISDVKSAADTALKAEFGQICEATSLMPERHLVTNGNGCRDEDNVINLCYLNEVTDRLLEVMEACVKDVPDCDWLSEWRELSEKFAFQYNPSLQPRAIVVLGCINKQPSLRHIKKVISIMGKSLESQVDPVLLESTLLALTRLQLVTRASLEVKSSLFWVAICALQMNAEHLYAAGLALLEQNLHHLDELELFATQSFAVALMKSRMPMERYFRPLEVAVGLSFQFSFHFAFVTHLIKGFRHSDPVTVARLIRLLDFCLELVSRNRACHKYEVNPDSSPYIAALLPVCEEARRHCVPRRKVESINGHSTTSSKVSSGRCATAPPSVHSAVDEPGNCSDSPSSGGHSSVKSCHNSAAESGVATTSGRNLLTIGEAQHRNKGRDGVRSKRPESRESGTTPTKMRKVGETSHDSDSSSGATSHVTSSSKRSSQRKHSIVSTCNALFGDDILDQSTQALLLTLLATLVKHSPNNSDVQVLFEYLAEASHIFPDVFPIVHSMMDHKINSILNQCEDAAILGHVQTIVHNAASHQSDEGVHRQFTILQEIGFGGMWRFAGPFAQVASLEHASDVVNLIDSIVLHHMGDVPDLTPVASRQSLNSALSAASADDLPESEEFELSDLDDDDDEDEDDKEEVNDNDDVMDARPSAEVAKTAKPGSFRNKGPKLTIKLPG